MNKLSTYLPLLIHITVTLVIGFGWVIPQSCIAGWNELTVGFIAAVLGFVPAYIAGLRIVAKTGKMSA